MYVNDIHVGETRGVHRLKEENSRKTLMCAKYNILIWEHRRRLRSLLLDYTICCGAGGGPTWLPEREVTLHALCMLVSISMLMRMLVWTH